MNRFVKIVLNLVIVFSLTACGTASPSQPEPGVTDVNPTQVPPVTTQASTLTTQALLTTADLTRVAAGLPADPAE